MCQFMTKAWLKFKGSTHKSTVTKRFLQDIIGEYAFEYPNVCDLILILKSISPGTASLERNFTKLSKTCCKDRSSSDTPVVSYLLSTLSIVGEEELWKKTREFL